MAAVNDVYEMTIWNQVANQAGVIVRHYIVQAVGGAGASDAIIALDFAIAVNGPVKSLLTTAAQFRGVGVQKIWPLPKLVRVFNTTGQDFGTVAGDPMPTQISGLISLKTLFAGRGFRGRAYIPFAGETDNANTSQPTAGYIGRLDTLAALFTGLLMTGTGGNTVDLKGGVWQRGPHIFTPCTTSISRDRWATQRRRGAFGQGNMLVI